MQAALAATLFLSSFLGVVLTANISGRSSNSSRELGLPEINVNTGGSRARQLGLPEINVNTGASKARQLGLPEINSIPPSTGTATTSSNLNQSSSARQLGSLEPKVERKIGGASKASKPNINKVKSQKDAQAARNLLIQPHYNQPAYATAYARYPPAPYHPVAPAYQPATISVAPVPVSVGPEGTFYAPVYAQPIRPYQEHESVYTRLKPITYDLYELTEPEVSVLKKKIIKVISGKANQSNYVKPVKLSTTKTILSFKSAKKSHSPVHSKVYEPDVFVQTPVHHKKYKPTIITIKTTTTERPLLEKKIGVVEEIIEGKEDIKEGLVDKVDEKLKDKVNIVKGIGEVKEDIVDKIIDKIADTKDSIVNKIVDAKEILGKKLNVDDGRPKPAFHIENGKIVDEPDLEGPKVIEVSTKRVGNSDVIGGPRSELIPAVHIENGKIVDEPGHEGPKVIEVSTKRVGSSDVIESIPKVQDVSDRVFEEVKPRDVDQGGRVNIPAQKLGFVIDNNKPTKPDSDKPSNIQEENAEVKSTSDQGPRMRPQMVEQAVTGDIFIPTISTPVENDVQIVPEGRQTGQVIFEGGSGPIKVETNQPDKNPKPGLNVVDGQIRSGFKQGEVKVDGVQLDTDIGLVKDDRKPDKEPIIGSIRSDFDESKNGKTDVDRLGLGASPASIKIGKGGLEVAGTTTNTQVNPSREVEQVSETIQENPQISSKLNGVEDDQSGRIRPESDQTNASSDPRSEKAQKVAIPALEPVLRLPKVDVDLAENQALINRLTKGVDKSSSNRIESQVIEPSLGVSPTPEVGRKVDLELGKNSGRINLSKSQSKDEEEEGEVDSPLRSALSNVLKTNKASKSENKAPQEVVEPTVSTITQVPISLPITVDLGTRSRTQTPSRVSVLNVAQPQIKSPVVVDLPSKFDSKSQSISRAPELEAPIKVPATVELAIQDPIEVKNPVQVAVPDVHIPLQTSVMVDQGPKNPIRIESPLAISASETTQDKGPVLVESSLIDPVKLEIGSRSDAGQASVKIPTATELGIQGPIRIQSPIEAPVLKVSQSPIETPVKLELGSQNPIEVNTSPDLTASEVIQIPTKTEIPVDISLSSPAKTNLPLDISVSNVPKASIEGKPRIELPVVTLKSDVERISAKTLPNEIELPVGVRMPLKVSEKKIPIKVDAQIPLKLVADVPIKNSVDLETPLKVSHEAKLEKLEAPLKFDLKTLIDKATGSIRAKGDIVPSIQAAGGSGRSGLSTGSSERDANINVNNPMDSIASSMDEGLSKLGKFLGQPVAAKVDVETDKPISPMLELKRIKDDKVQKIQDGVAKTVSAMRELLDI